MPKTRARQSRAFQPQVGDRRLEVRNLLSATTISLQYHNLVVKEGSGVQNDDIFVSAVGNNYVVQVNAATYTFPKCQVSSIIVNGCATTDGSSVDVFNETNLPLVGAAGHGDYNVFVDGNGSVAFDGTSSNNFSVSMTGNGCALLVASEHGTTFLDLEGKNDSLIFTSATSFVTLGEKTKSSTVVVMDGTTYLDVQHGCVGVVVWCGAELQLDAEGGTTTVLALGDADVEVAYDGGRVRICHIGGCC